MALKKNNEKSLRGIVEEVPINREVVALRKQGGSGAVLIPAKFLRQMELKPGLDSVELSLFRMGGFAYLGMVLRKKKEG